MTKILLADDVKLYLALAKTFLARNDYEFLTATSGPSALDLLRTEKPHLSIIEKSLPGIGAFDIRREQLRDPDLACIPMIVTTNGIESLESVRGQAEGLGIDCVLVKPFHVVELTQAVQKLLPARNRRHPRWSLYLEAGVKTVDHAGYLNGGSVNISVGGMLLEVTEPLSVGQRVNLQLTIATEDEPLAVQGIVVRYAKEQKRAGLCYGIEFVTISPEVARRLRSWIEARGGVPNGPEGIS